MTMQEMSVREVLAETGASISEAEVAAVLRQAIETVNTAPDMRVTSRHDTALLLDHSGLNSPARAAVHETLGAPGDVAALRARVATRAASWSGQSWTATETARRLGLSRSGLSRRVSEARIYAVPAGRSHLFPSWQFVQDAQGDWQTLPELAQALPGTTTHPAGVAAAMTTPQDETRGMSPREWLIAGGDPAPVRELLAGLDTW